MLSLVLPCYNCAAYIDRHIKKLLTFLQVHFPQFEIILVNDGSSDNTLEHLRTWEGDQHIRVISFQYNQGKGAAVKKGMLESRGEYVLFTDADVPYGVSVLKDIVQKLKEGRDVVIGTRLSDGGKEGQRKHRTVLSRIFVLLANVVLRESVPDTQAGVKGFRREAAHTIFERVTIPRFCFDVEVIAIAETQGRRIGNIPVILEYQNVSTVRVGLDGFMMLVDLARIFIRWRIMA